MGRSARCLCVRQRREPHRQNASAKRQHYQNNSYQIFDHERDGIHLIQIFEDEWLPLGLK
jgi:hypothetical protein